MAITKFLPYIDIQHDALTVYNDVNQGIVLKEDIWVSGYKIGSTSIHGKVKLEFEEGGGVGFKPRDGVEVKRVNRTDFTVTIPGLQVTNTPVRFPLQTIHPKYEKKKPISPELHINTIAHSPTSPHLVIGGPDGYCVVIPTSGDGCVNLKGHVGDVLSVKYFPSGQVVLTSSSDLSIRVFSAVDGLNPRTLKGHTRAVTSLQIVGIGKKVLSGSKDGTVRLWEVGSGKEVHKWAVGGMVEALELFDGGGVLGLTTNEDTIVAGLQSGHLVFWSFSALQEPTLVVPPEEGLGHLVSMTISPELGIIVTGHTDGSIVLRPLSSLTTPTIIKRNESPIYSLTFVGRDLLVGTGAGLPCKLGVTVNPNGIDVVVKEEYAGWQAVSIESFAVGKDGGKEVVWCAGEGEIRRY